MRRMTSGAAAPACDLRRGADFGRPFASILDPPLITATCNGNYLDLGSSSEMVLALAALPFSLFLGAFRLRAIFLQEVLLRRTGCRGLQNNVHHSYTPTPYPPCRQNVFIKGKVGQFTC